MMLSVTLVRSFWGEDGQDESYRPALRWGAAYALVSLSLRRLRSIRARGFRLGRSLRTRRNFPVVWYKTKKKSHSFIAHVLACFLVLFTFDAPVESVHSIWWVGGLVCARWLGVDITAGYDTPSRVSIMDGGGVDFPERNFFVLSRLDEPCECLYRCHFGFKA